MAKHNKTHFCILLSHTSHHLERLSLEILYVAKKLMVDGRLTWTNGETI